MGADETPRFPVKELVEQSYQALGVARHVAVGAMSLAGQGESDQISVVEFQAAVAAFLRHPLA